MQIAKRNALHFDPVKHRYTLDGERLPSVTTILNVIAKPALIQWAANMAGEYVISQVAGADESYLLTRAQVTEWAEESKSAHRKKKEAGAARGTDIHAHIAAIVTEAIEREGGYIPPVVTDDPQVYAFCDWADGKRFLACEQKMCSVNHRFAGTCDLVYQDGDHIFIGDVKKYNRLYDKIPFVQMGGYSIMLEESGIAVTDGAVILLPDAGGFEVHTAEIAEYREAFMSAFNLYKTLQR